VRTTYQQRASGEPDRFCVVDATRAVEAVTQQICSRLANLLDASR
jgi:thymidylate kinase